VPPPILWVGVLHVEVTATQGIAVGRSTGFQTIAPDY
jgi:hypothetical protein